MAQSSDMDNTIITELVSSELITYRNNSQPYMIYIIKFGASWCGPCQKIKQVCENYFYKINQNHKNITCIDIDVDETIELYTVLKKRKMVNGLPTILSYYGGHKESDHWFIPDDSISGGDIEKVKDFFERCIKHSVETYSLISNMSNTSI